MVSFILDCPHNGVMISVFLWFFFSRQIFPFLTIYRLKFGFYTDLMLFCQLFFTFLWSYQFTHIHLMSFLDFVDMAEWYESYILAVIWLSNQHILHIYSVSLSNIEGIFLYYICLSLFDMANIIIWNWCFNHHFLIKCMALICIKFLQSKVL